MALETRVMSMRVHEVNFFLRFAADAMNSPMGTLMVLVLILPA